MPRPRDPLTLDLFDWEPPAMTVGYGEDVTGRGPLDLRISRLLAKALQDMRDEGIDRGEIARRMSERLGRSVSKEMLYKWSSPGSSEHRITLDAFAALIAVTERWELLGVLPGLFGYAVVSDDCREIIRLHQMKERRQTIAQHSSAIDAEIAALETRMRGRR
ncbi:hypothetical protein [Afifella pfennigii]|uniref:hypothetical protein n=1 Tax=Afifella pfennigii TaxID=209897 RepID=UPI00047DB287|nr:hypothetical protein [Afifella pfennigii]